MRGIKYSIMIIFLWLFIYALRYRISISTMYKKWLINEHLFTGGIFTIENSKNYIESVYYPSKDQFKFCVSWSNNVIWIFLVYDVLGYKEYKPSWSIQWGPQWFPWNFWVNNTQKIMFDTEVGIKHVFRNSWLDRWGKLVWVAIQMAPISWNTVLVKRMQDPFISSDILERQKQFDDLTDLPIVESIKVFRGDGLLCGKAITWYNSSHSYSSLGIKIYTTDECSPAFETEPPFILKNGGILVDPYHPGQYIKVIAKDLTETIQDIFDRDYKNQFASGCNPLDLKAWWLFSWSNTDNMQEFLVSNSWSCIAWWNGNHQTYMSFLYNKNKPDRYYLFVHQDGCSGGRCNVFNKIELY